MYRPTVRYDDSFKKFVDDMFHATTLDRNQILRAALFSAAYSKEFQQILKPYMKGSDFPVVPWSLQQDSFWLDQKPRGDDLDDGSTEATKGDGIDGADGRDGGRRITTVGAPIPRRDGKVSSGAIRVTGGAVVYTVN
jgi:hypothetical protein